MRGKPSTAQSLTIRLLHVPKHPLDRLGVYRQARNRLSGKHDTIRQLELCMLMAGEQEQAPKDYIDFILLAKTILARQTDRAIRDIKKKDIGEALDKKKSSATNLIDRIQDHVRELKPTEILNLCQGFHKEADRVFWRNQVYLCFPDMLREPDITDGPVLDCLQAVWDSLNEDEQENAQDAFISYWSWFEKLERSESDAQNQSTGLYEFLEAAIRNAKVKKTRLYDELDIDPDTYAAYKRAWASFEDHGCRADYPKNRLSRERLMYLAVFLEMDYYTTAGMLSAAGYDFHDTTADKIVVGYLLDRRYTRADALKNLHPQQK